jgi:DNA-binding NtrC family response regulator
VKAALESLVQQMVEKGILFDEARTEFERNFIKHVLDRCSGNRSRVASALGMHRNTLTRKMTELHLNPRRNGMRVKPATRRVKAS